MEALRSKLKENCVSVPIWVLRNTGISLNAHESFKYKILSCFALLLTCLFPFSCLHTVTHSNGNFDVMCNALLTLFGAVTALAEILVILLNRTSLREICEKLINNQKIYNTQEWSRAHVYRINKKMVVIMVLIYFALFFFYFLSIIQRLIISDSSKWRTPMSDVTAINISYSPNFEIAWAFQVVTVTVIALVYWCSALLIAAITVDLTVQVEIFSNDLKLTFDSSILQNNSNHFSDINILIKDIVIRHVSLIGLAHEVEKVCSALIMVHVMGSLGPACFSLYYSLSLPLLSPYAIQAQFELVVLLSSVFCLSYFGDKFSQASENIATACYDVDFVGQDVRFQRSLCIIMMGSYKPMKLTVGGFADLNLPVFMWILRSTYTYSMMLMKSVK